MRYTLLDHTWREIAQFDFAADLLSPAEEPHDISDALTSTRVRLADLCRAAYLETPLDATKPLMLIRRVGVAAELEVKFGHSTVTGWGYNQVDATRAVPTLLVGWLASLPVAAVKFESAPHFTLVQGYQALSEQEHDVSTK